MRYSTVLAFLLFSISAVLLPLDATAVCGDGVLEEPLEQCDDGNLLPSDCCSPECEYEQAGTSCELGNVCAEFLGSECDGAGSCELVLDGCAPLSRFPERWYGKLVDADPSSRDLLKLRYKSSSPGSSPDEWYGDPSAGTRYAICVTTLTFSFDGRFRGTEVLHSVELPTGAGWRKKATGYVYREPGAAPGPFRSVRLRAKPSDSAGQLLTTVKVKATGPALMLPPPATPTEYIERPFVLGDGFPTICVANELGNGVMFPDVLGFGIRIEPRRVTWKRARLPD